MNGRMIKQWVALVVVARPGAELGRRVLAWLTDGAAPATPRDDHDGRTAYWVRQYGRCRTHEHVAAVDAQVPLVAQVDGEVVRARAMALERVGVPVAAE